MNPPVLITGGAGFIGANLADRLASEGRTVRVYDSLARPGTERNLAWLRDRHGERIRFDQAISATASGWRTRWRDRLWCSTSPRRWR